MAIIASVSQRSFTLLPWHPRGDLDRLIQFVVYMLGAAIAFGILLDSIDGGWGAVTELAALR